MNRLYRIIFERAESSAGKIVAASAIGAILGFLSGRKVSESAVLPATLCGAAVGLLAAILLLMAERFRTSTMGLIFISLLGVALVAVILLMVVELKLV